MATGSPGAGGYGSYMVAASSSLLNMAGQAASAAGSVAGQVQNMGASVRDGVASVCQVDLLRFLLYVHLLISKSWHCQQSMVEWKKLSELAVLYLLLLVISAVHFLCKDKAWMTQQSAMGQLGMWK